MRNVIVLNASYEYLNSVSWQRAVKLIYQGKVEVVKNSKKMVKNFERTIKMFIPMIIRLIKFVRVIFKKRVPFSRKNVHFRDNFTCQYCGSLEDICIDHIIPKAKGGKTTWENCVSSCKDCNNKKEDKLPSVVKMFVRRQPIEPTINEFLNLKMKSKGINLEEMLEGIDADDQ